MVTTSRILGADGQPIKLAELAEPQTSKVASLHHEFQGHPTRGLTPTKLAAILDDAEQGNPVAQYELYEDMEEKDAHIASEMGKRRRALLVGFEIVPPRNPSAAERRAADQLGELVSDVPDFDDVLFDASDAIGKGFAGLEIEWHRLEGFWLPKTITHRPQSWFTIHRGYRQEIRLRDGVQGQPLTPFGWIVHTHKAKSGYLERAALMRALVWPYLFKNYSVGDLAEFLEIYGIPLRLGKYPSGASEKEKMTLLKALVSIGHNAAGIVPNGMELEFHDAAQGDPKAFELMIGWCERSQSKAILGGTLTSQADGASSTNALGNVHNEVRKDLRDSDLRQVQTSLSRDLVYAIAALNGLAPSGIRRAPTLRFSVDEPEDIKAYADALPKLVAIGLRPTVQWAHEKLGIPEPEDGQPVLGAAPAPAPVAAPVDKPVVPPAKVAAATAQTAAAQPPEQLLDRTGRQARPAVADWVQQIRGLVETAASLEAIRDGLEQLLPGMTLDQYADAMAEALAAAALAGRYEILQEVAGGRG